MDTRVLGKQAEPRAPPKPKSRVQRRGNKRGRATQAARPALVAVASRPLQKLAPAPTLSALRPRNRIAAPPRASSLVSSQTARPHADPVAGPTAPQIAPVLAFAAHNR